MKPITFEKEQAEYLQRILEDATVYPGTKEEKLYKSIVTKLKNAQKPPIKVSSRKAKGREFQYWVCRKIADMFEMPFNQQDDDCLIHSREMGQNGTDIVIRGILRKLFPFDIECKCCEQLSIPEWIKQSKANVKEGRHWLVVFKKKEIGEPIVLMGWDTFEDVYKKSINIDKK